MFEQGEIISYLDMCRAEGVNLQRGMNFRLRGDKSVFLMSVRKGAPYADRVENDGKVLIYEGHDTPSTSNGPKPKIVDQPLYNSFGSLAQNGLFFEAAKRAKAGRSTPEMVKVYEKIKSGIWVYNGLFALVDAWQEVIKKRKVFKSKLELSEQTEGRKPEFDRDHNRMIPSPVKLEVWKRDKGQCVKCGSNNNLHFDHIIPFSKGGASLTAENIQLLCMRHNLEKRDKIQ